MKKVDSETGRIKRLAVIPEQQRKGVAESLMKNAIAWSKKEHLTKITLATGKNEKAHFLYKKCGFSIVGEDNTRNDYLMERPL